MLVQCPDIRSGVHMILPVLDISLGAWILVKFSGDGPDVQILVQVSGHWPRYPDIGPDTYNLVQISGYLFGCDHIGWGIQICDWVLVF